MLRSLILAAAIGVFIAVPSAQAATSLTLTLTSYTTVAQTHDTAPKGKANAGDSIAAKDLLVTTANNELGKKKGKPVGYDAYTLLYTSATTQSITGVTTFPGIGTLSFKGAMTVRKDGTVHIAVTKGTGSFKGAKGTLIIGKGSKNGQQAPNTYVLHVPKAVCIGHCA